MPATWREFSRSIDEDTDATGNSMSDIEIATNEFDWNRKYPPLDSSHLLLPFTRTRFLLPSSSSSTVTDSADPLFRLTNWNWKDETRTTQSRDKDKANEQEEQQTNQTRTLNHSTKKVTVATPVTNAADQMVDIDQAQPSPIRRRKLTPCQPVTLPHPSPIVALAVTPIEAVVATPMNATEVAASTPTTAPTTPTLRPIPSTSTVAAAAVHDNGTIATTAISSITAAIEEVSSPAPIPLTSSPAKADVATKTSTKKTRAATKKAKKPTPREMALAELEREEAERIERQQQQLQQQQTNSEQLEPTSTQPQIATAISATSITATTVIQSLNTPTEHVTSEVQQSMIRRRQTRGAKKGVIGANQPAVPESAATALSTSANSSHMEVDDANTSSAHTVASIKTELFGLDSDDDMIEPDAEDVRPNEREEAAHAADETHPPTTPGSTPIPGPFSQLRNVGSELLRAKARAADKAKSLLRHKKSTATATTTAQKRTRSATSTTGDRSIASTATVEEKKPRAPRKKKPIIPVPIVSLEALQSMDQPVDASPSNSIEDMAAVGEAVPLTLHLSPASRKRARELSSQVDHEVAPPSSASIVQLPTSTLTNRAPSFVISSPIVSSQTSMNTISPRMSSVISPSSGTVATIVSSLAPISNVQRTASISSASIVSIPSPTTGQSLSQAITPTTAILTSQHTTSLPATISPHPAAIPLPIAIVRSSSSTSVSSHASVNLGGTIPTPSSPAASSTSISTFTSLASSVSLPVVASRSTSVSVPRRRRAPLGPAAVMVTNEGESILAPVETPPTVSKADTNKKSKKSKRQRWRENRKRKHAESTAGPNESNLTLSTDTTSVPTSFTQTQTPNPTSTSTPTPVVSAASTPTPPPTASLPSGTPPVHQPPPKRARPLIV